MILAFAPELWERGIDATRMLAHRALLVGSLSLIWHSFIYVTAEKYTASVDYGFGPLFISFESTEGELPRCQNITINLGGGFGPYNLSE